MPESYMHYAAEEFVKAVKKSAEYRQYSIQLDKIKKQPDLFQRVNEFRLKNFTIQNTQEAEALMDSMDELDKEYEQLREDKLVEDFLEAETAFCRMMQEINMLVTRELDFQ